MPEMTLCEILYRNKLLLKKANRGVSKGKWNGLGGKMERGERPSESAVREVREESGLVIRRPHKLGIITFYRGGRHNLFVRMHVFFARSFSGRLREGEEGELRWFKIKSIPYHRMWHDDTFWMPLFLKGFVFDAEFVYDKDMKRVIEYTIKNIRTDGS